MPTKKEEKIIAGEAEADPEMAKQDDSKVKQAFIVTGGIDSTVLEAYLKKVLPNVEVVSITDKSLFDPKDPTNIENYDPLIGFADKNKINVIHFANNYEEGLVFPEKNYAFFQQLNDRALKAGIQISRPFETVTKDRIIQIAIDELDLDLSKTNEPIKGESKQAQESQRIRAEGFKKAFSVKNSKWIEDPFAPKEEKKENATEKPAATT